MRTTGSVTLLLAAIIGAIVSLSGAVCTAAPDEPPLTTASAYAQWQNGPGKDATFFPIAVWLQDPRDAPKYQALGVNLNVAWWRKGEYSVNAGGDGSSVRLHSLPHLQPQRSSCEIERSR
jgi:hypothetical protein